MKDQFYVHPPPGACSQSLDRKGSVDFLPIVRRLARLPLLAFPVCLLLTVLAASPVFAQSSDTTWPAQITGENDALQILEWQSVYHFEHPGFSRWCCALGDIDDDGFDDFAMASSYDTTFIFLGGDPFDHEPAFFLLGGSTGLVSADFNGDGRRDLVTAVDFKNSELDPESRGRIYVYFGKDASPFLGPTADLELRGESGQYWGAESLAENGGHRSGLQAFDFNGDGYDDLLTLTYTGLRVAYNPIIFLGGPGFDNVPDAEILPVDRGNTNSYPSDLLTGDLNGDDCDDVLICGSYIEGPIRIYFWDLFLGNRQGRASPPDRTLRSDIGWSPDKGGRSAMFDVNGDGIDDIVDAEEHRDYGDPLVFLGSRDLPENIEPNDSIANPWPEFGGMPGAMSIRPVGDMNGDGTRDLLISWTTYFVRDGSLYYLYPMRPGGLVRDHTGYIGTIPDADDVVDGAYDIGDVNGDGFDDIAMLGRGFAEPPAIGYQQSRHFKIFLGASYLRTAVTPLATAQSVSLELYPNPVLAGASSVMLRSRGLETGPATIEIHDALGRLVMRSVVDSSAGLAEYPLQTSGLRPGSYFIFLRQGNTVTRTMLTIL
ncbi:MAG: T9SS type A sorting domain-containing protein [Bacteroidota bacterium]